LLGKRATLAIVPDTIIDEWQKQGFDALWLMGVWTIGPSAAQAALASPSLRAEYGAVLPGWKAEDVVGSPYAISDYHVHPDFGGDAALRAFRARLASCGIKLILDFVPNHVGRDHEWLDTHPEYFIRATGGGEQKEGYFRHGDSLFAHGRDPYFPPWTDTAQLDYRQSATKTAMRDLLCSVAAQCDGVRCDMAMLVLDDIFRRTWGDREEAGAGRAEFWAQAIDAVRATHKDFMFIAECYWGLEERLQLLGFDYTYHKTIYDSIVRSSLGSIGPQLASGENIGRSLFFLENHDEARLATAIADTPRRHAAIILMLCLPGARLVHDGQTEGRRMRHPLQLARLAEEAIDKEEASFYRTLFAALKASSVGKGTWKMLETGAASSILAFLWETPSGQRDIVVVNGEHRMNEGHIVIRFQGIAARNWELQGRLFGKHCTCEGDQMCGEGLYVDLAPFESEIFRLTPLPVTAP
jgi:hypothetical protein